MISVITPTNDARFLKETWESLKKQTYQDFEWIVVPNNGAKINIEDQRIRVIPYEAETDSIGRIEQLRQK